MPKIAVLLSGGVDSSVALALLRERGYNVTAFYLKIWLEDELSYLGSCPWEEDLEYAKKVCEKLDVPLKTINLQKEYWDKVVRYAINEVRLGRTPSPDIFCNKFIKFGAFFDKVDGKFDKVATGHYAQVEERDDVFLLKKAVDSLKDQTYFLAHLNQAQLSKIMFPIGALKKEAVRRLAKKYDLPTKDRKDSQGICFLGKIKFSSFIKHHLGTKKGDLIEIETGQKVGEHDGFWYYTVGQRKRIGLSGGPWYVVKKDTGHNIVYISKQYFTSEKKRDTLKISSFNWIGGVKPDKRKMDVKIRHGEYMYKGKLEFIGDDEAIVTLNERDQGLAPGQFTVFYDGDICLGCGVIN
jgi:tRNA-specific 2-thiouridylase